MSLLASAVDRALEWSVVGSYTRLGLVARRRLGHFSTEAEARMDGRVVVMSGATSGIGYEAARSFVRLGAELVVIARNAKKAEATCSALRAETTGAKVEFVVADTGDLKALREAAKTIEARHPSIDVLIHNAGALDDVRGETADGIERTVASQVVGPFLLTELLLPSLRRGRQPRVLWVASGGMYSEPLDTDRLEMSAREYDGTVAYARAKRAQVTLSAILAERLRPDGILVHAMHPGWADTPGVERSLPTFRRVVGKLLRTPAEGADTLIWLAAATSGLPVETSGLFFHDRRPRTLHRLGSTRRSDTTEARSTLYDWVRRRSGLVDGDEEPGAGSALG